MAVSGRSLELLEGIWQGPSWKWCALMRGFAVTIKALGSQSRIGREGGDL